MPIMKQRLRTLAKETVAIVNRGQYTARSGHLIDISEDVRNAVAATRLYLPEEPLPAPAIRIEPTVEVTNETTLAAAQRLTRDDADDVAALVFASAKNPGGGFLNGARAQEESIARSSALYTCQRAARDFYAFHRSQHDLRYSDRVIYSPAVPVFRDDRGELLETPYRVAFLTAAAPNLGAIMRNQPEYADSVPVVLRARAIRVLQVAAHHGHRRLVLGAWGCGVFRNDPVGVADAFADALAAVPAFRHVTFAVLDTHSAVPTYAAFAARFAGHPDQSSISARSSRLHRA